MPENINWTRIDAIKVVVVALLVGILIGSVAMTVKWGNDTIARCTNTQDFKESFGLIGYKVVSVGVDAFVVLDFSDDRPRTEFGNVYVSTHNLTSWRFSFVQDRTGITHEIDISDGFVSDKKIGYPLGIQRMRKIMLEDAKNALKAP